MGSTKRTRNVRRITHGKCKDAPISELLPQVKISNVLLHEQFSELADGLLLRSGENARVVSTVSLILAWPKISRTNLSDDLGSGGVGGVRHLWQA